VALLLHPLLVDDGALEVTAVLAFSFTECKQGSIGGVAVLGSPYY
jgi:hypothetical protein